MIGFQNYDSSFVQLQVEGFTDKNLGFSGGFEGKVITKNYIKQDISDRILSVEITEEMGKIITGNIQLLDYDDMRLTNSLKGKRINLKWGYANIDSSGQLEYRKQQNPQELYSPDLVTRVVSGRIKNPSGGGDENGTFTFNCSFMGNEFLDKDERKKRKPFTSGTKKDVIIKIFEYMGIDKYYIDFRRQNEKVTRNTAIRQNVNNFKFLSNKSSEWRAMFRIATSKNPIDPTADPPEYGMVGLFCDYDKDVVIKSFLEDTLGASGDSCFFEYKLSGSPNVKSYTWQQHQGASGAGDNVQVQVVNGKTEFYYTQAKSETVKYYKLNTAKMQKELSKQGSIASQSQWLEKMFAEANQGMDNLVQKKYFIPVNETTAPQGIGLSMTLETIGNPLYTCPARAKFGKGFPDFFLSNKKRLTFYQVRVTHKISRAGYNCTIQIADAFTVSGGSLVG